MFGVNIVVMMMRLSAINIVSESNLSCSSTIVGRFEEIIVIYIILYYLLIGEISV